MSEWTSEQLDDLMDRYVFGLLDDVTTTRTRRAIEQRPEWQLAYEAAAARKKALAEGIGSGATENAMTRGPSGEEIIAAGRQRERKLTRRRRTIGRVFGGTAAAAAIVIAACWIHVVSISPPGRIVRVIGQTELMAGSVASLRTFVLDVSSQPVASVPIKLSLKSSGSPQSDTVLLAQWTTDDSGGAAGTLNVPDWPSGQYTLLAESGDAKLSTQITIRRPHKVYLATDKPIYQPGQTIHMRCMVLRKPDLRPAGGAGAEFKVTDPGGTIVFAQPVKLSEFGIGWADMPLDTLIKPGRYIITASCEGDESTQVADILTYKLPAFSVKLSTDKPYYLPGETIIAGAEVMYHFGKPVANAEVELELTGQAVAGLSDKLRTATATTDATGKAVVRMKLPRRLFGLARGHGGARLRLSAKVTDTAGQQNTGHRTIPVADQDIRIAVAAENGQLAGGLESRVFIVTSYPDGRPAETVVSVENLARSVRTDETGVAVVMMANLSGPLRVSARDSMGKAGRTEVTLQEAAGEAFILRTDKGLYDGGQTMAVEILAARDGQVFLDVVRDRQTLLTRAVQVSGGRATLAFDLLGELSGTLHLHAYRLDDEGRWVGRDALVIVRPARTLNVKVEQDRELEHYRPGQDANLTFSVTTPDGRPSAAALSLGAVDEAVYSVERSAPGLAQTLSGLDAKLLTPAVDVHGFDMTLMNSHEQYARAALAAAVTPLKDANHSPLQQLIDRGYLQSGANRLLGAPNIRRFIKSNPEVEEALGPDMTAELLGQKTGLHSLDTDSREQAWILYNQQDEKATDLAVTASFAAGIAFMVALAIPALFWPSSHKVKFLSWHVNWFAVAFGVILISCFCVLTMILPMYTTASNDARASAAASDVQTVLSQMELDRIQHPEAWSDVKETESALARVRTYFPETLMWRPQVITDAAGRANLTIPMADSITTWRLSGSAVDRTGRLGAVESSIKVFQPFFVDVDAPATLTAGDEISAPLIVYNYTQNVLNISLKASTTDGLEVVGSATQRLRLKSGQVRRAYVRVRALRPGTGSIKLDASASAFTDAVVRTVNIVPAGTPQSAVVNGSIESDEQFVDITVPSDAVADSVAVRMKLYPSRFSELLDGMEGIFRKPYGCFEQTSSVTYPNVMALAYMKSMGIGSTGVHARATKFVQMGYQRLLSFEVPGGGFSLYGESPANLTLSSLGLMQFVDMSAVQYVDPAVIDRTAAWLAGKQHTDGSWDGSLPMSYRSSYPLATTAYVTWAMAQATTSEKARDAAARGAAWIARRIDGIRDPHTLALCINALQATGGYRQETHAAAEKLADMGRRTTDDMCLWPNSSASMSYGCGTSGTFETTALAVIALHASGRRTDLIPLALKWLAKQRDSSGTWQTTQATVLALKAMLAGSARSQKRDTDATVIAELAQGGASETMVLGKLMVAAEKSEAVHTVALKGLNKPGAYRLRLRSSNAAGMAYQVSVHYHSLRPAVPADEPVSVSTSYDRTQLKTGQTVKARAVVTNNTSRTVNIVLVDIPVPPGFAVDPAGLEALRSRRVIDRYSLTGRGVIVYVPQLAAKSRLEITFDMTARYPLRAVAAPAQVYAYYQPEINATAKSVRFEVLPQL